jgi:uncharacterized membrane protein SpoIIM required for sporulation
MKPTRRPVLGFFAGVFLGAGIAIMLFVFGILPMTVMWLGVVVLLGAVLGVVVSYVAPVRGGKAPAPSG